jgi:hypothetical protein
MKAVKLLGATAVAAVLAGGYAWAGRHGSVP